VTIHAAMLLLNPDHADVRRDIASRADMHKTVMSLLPGGMGDSPREQSNLLWRTDERNGFTQLFVQSTQELATWNLPDQYVMNETPLSYGDVVTSLPNGAEVAYRIAANPTAVRTRGTRKHRIALHDDAAHDWWAARSEQAGLTHDTDFESSVAEVSSITGKGATVLLSVVNFTGRAFIHDEAAFRNAVSTGVGRGKAYGAGLLLAVPSNSL
jgi:CRISPR system Cascade subunit CasE